MSITPEKLRELADRNCGPVLRREELHMLADAMEIADSCARADIESSCTARGDGDDYRNWWWDTSSADAEDEEMIALSLRYLEARGLIERNPTDAPLVRFKVAV